MKKHIRSLRWLIDKHRREHTKKFYGVLCVYAISLYGVSSSLPITVLCIVVPYILILRDDRDRYRRLAVSYRVLLSPMHEASTISRIHEELVQTIDDEEKFEVHFGEAARQLRLRYILGEDKDERKDGQENQKSE